jgi:hypothetical protein
MISKTTRPCTAVVAALLYATTTASAQENRGTAEQRAACAPDAFKLCSSYIPDAAMVESCLRQKKSDLSDACRSIFEQSAGQKPISESRRFREW